MMNIEWCKVFSKDLLAFNKMFIARKGKIPCNVIELHGTDEDIEFAAETEKAIFEKEGYSIVISDELPAARTSFQNAFFVKKANGVGHLTIDVTGAAELAIISKFAKILGFDTDVAVIKKTIKDSGFGDQVKTAIENNGMEVYATQVISNHFANYIDNEFHIDDLGFTPVVHTKADMPVAEVKTEEKAVVEVNKTESEVATEAAQSLLADDDIVVNETTKESKPVTTPTKKPTATETEKPIEKVVEKTAEKAEKPTNVAPNKSQDVQVAEKKDETNTVVKHGTAGNMLNQFKANANAIHKQAEEDAVAKKKAEEEAAKAAPVPEKKDKNTGYKIKEQLTDEEAAENEKLLAALSEKYQDVMNYIDETCNTRFRIIRNKMKECLDEKKFVHQFAPDYMEISDDYSSELYAKIYELDTMTVEFNKKVTHQIIDLGCPFCGHSWKEDVTFLDKGPQFIECPKCYSERGFEKQ